MKYTYLIVYAWTSAVGSGHGNTGIDRPEKIETIEHIRDVEQLIRDSMGAPSVVITNLVLLKEEG